LLRAAREERGLDLLAVHDRLSRPITQLEALENGDLAGLPDQALALSTLRRYASFLGLDGDALALQMIDAWSATTTATPAAAVSPASRGATRTQVGAGAVTNVVTAVTTGRTTCGPSPRPARCRGWVPDPPPEAPGLRLRCHVRSAHRTFPVVPRSRSGTASGPWPRPGAGFGHPRR